jgi:hypothetical protein
LLTKIDKSILQIALGCIIFATVIKKVFILMIAFLYLTVSSGLAMNIHYCMGKVASVTFGNEQDHNDGNCSKCGMNKTETHCCNDETEFIKLTDSQQFNYLLELIQGSSMLPPVETIALQVSEQGNSMEPFIDYFSPPPPTLNKVYLALNVFRI